MIVTTTANHGKRIAMPATTVATFLNELFIDGDDGQIILAQKKDKGGFIRFGSYDSVADAEAAVKDTEADLYLKINRMDVAKIRASNKFGIGGKDEITVVRAIGLDVDTAAKSPKYPPRDIVLERVRMLMPDPSLIVSSDGTTDGGLHLYYILDEPFIVDNDVWEKSVQYVNAIARQIREELQEILPEYQVDHCENIERIFRIAGGLRADGKRVEILENAGHRYALADLQQYPVERGTTCITASDREDSPITSYLEATGINTIEDYLRDRLGWTQLDDTHWIRPDSESQMPSGEIFQGVNGEWGVTIKTGGVPQLEQMKWYSLPALYTAYEFGGDWRSSGAHARVALAAIAGGQSAASVFSRYYSEYDKHQMNDRAAAIWCYERIDNLLYVPDQKEWRVWNGSAWVPGEEQVFELVSQCMLDVAVNPPKHFHSIPDPKLREVELESWKRHYKSYLNTRAFNGLKRALESTLYRMSSDFDDDPEIIHSPSLRINLRTGEREPASVKFLNTQVTKIDPADAECPRWNTFLYEIMDGDIEMTGYLQRVAGYCMTGLVDEQVMFLFHGDGQNGKSVFTETLEYVLGEYATQLDQSAITGKADQHPTAIASLFRRRLALSAETDIGCSLREHTVKRITSTDSLIARRMREDFWTFRPTHKLILSTNNMPTIVGSDEGIWRRLKVVKFNAHFADPDRNLARKLKLESPGILNWMLQGAREYLERGLQHPRSVNEIGDDLRREMDIIGSWMRDECELASQWNKQADGSYERDGTILPADRFETSAAQLYDSYREYCERYNRPCFSSVGFGRKLAANGLTRTLKTAKRLAFWDGVALKSSY